MPSPSRYESLDGSYRNVPDDTASLARYDLRIEGHVDPGQGLASGKSGTYPGGTIRMQYPHFEALGLDLGACFAGTLNVSIHPHTYAIHHPVYRFEQVYWRGPQNPENFALCRCCVETNAQVVEGFVYQPDPATKVGEFDDPHQLQIISPFIPGVRYGSAVVLHLRSAEIAIV